MRMTPLRLLESFSTRVLKFSESLFEFASLFLVKKRIKFSVDSEGTIGKLPLKDKLHSSPTIIEVGASDGRDTLEFAILFPKGTIFAFEPNLNSFSKSILRTRSLSNVSLFPIALNNKSGFAHFYEDSKPIPSSSSLLKPTEIILRHPNLTFMNDNESTVPCLTLSEFIAYKELDFVDLLWIDVQGAEKLVLEGAGEMLSVVKRIYAEVSLVPLYDGATSYSELRDFLDANGFFVEKEFMPSIWNGEGNVLFCRS